MRKRLVLLWTMSLLGVLLAGCSTDDEGSGFMTQAPDDPVTEPYVFRAGMSADSYSWDFGDGSAPAEGREVEHVYGVSSGTVTVTLKATQGEEAERVSEQVVIGDGDNAAPEPLLQISTDWAVTGQTFRASGAASSDPDGDPVLVSFHCTRLQDLAEVGGDHAHGGGGGAPYVGPQVSKFPAEVADLTSAQRTVEGDLCENARGDGFFTAGGSIEGGFEQPGLYRIIMLARDPVNPSISGFTDVFVSTPGDKPPTHFAESFEGTFEGGLGGSGQPVCDTASEGTVCDHASHRFALDLPANVLWINVTNDGAASEVGWQLFKGNKALAEDTGPVVLEDPETYGRGDYRLELTLDQGVQVGYTATIEGLYDMDPTHKFEAGH